MLFNSYPFLLVFLPLTFAAFHLAAARGAGPAKAVLLVASLVSYVSWDPGQAWVLAGSVAFNFLVGRALARGGGRALLAGGVAANVALLLAFKAWSTDQTGGAFSVGDVAIPLGISFFTFQQVGWLVDAGKGRTGPASLLDYALFVTFFPQIVMGPIVRWRDFSPQLAAPRLRRFDAAGVAAGLTVFIIGLFKKVVLADGVAPGVDALHASLAAGQPLGALEAWQAALGFTLQIYFDFSAYADMAIGLGRMFNLDLPLNFDSPYRATDRFDLWRRWHVTFTEFMRAHVFRPLARRRLPGGQVTALLVTAVVSGVWHGTGCTFVLWGLLNGLLLLAGHAWRSVRTRLLPAAWWRGRVARVRAGAWTLLLTVLLGALFRSASLDRTAALLRGLAGAEGWSTLGGWGRDPLTLVLIAILSITVFLLPNTHEFLGRHSTAIDPRPPGSIPAPRRPLFQFEFVPGWAWACAALLVASLLAVGGSSRFVYYQF